VGETFGRVWLVVGLLAIRAIVLLFVVALCSRRSRMMVVWEGGMMLVQAGHGFEPLIVALFLAPIAVWAI
jgi:hypothetical protein